MTSTLDSGRDLRQVENDDDYNNFGSSNKRNALVTVNEVI